MARSFTVAQLRTKARRRADQETTARITDDELNDYLSSAYTELYEYLAKAGLAYFESTQAITSTGVATVALPADHFQTIGVDYQLDTQRWVELANLQGQERNLFNQAGSRSLAYRLVGGSLVFYPTPPTGQVYRHIYVPAPADLTLDAQTVDGVSGWEELIVINAAIRCLAKDESDTAPLERERDQLRARIAAVAEDREQSHTHHVQDVESYGDCAVRPVDPGDWRYWK